MKNWQVYSEALNTVNWEFSEVFSSEKWTGEEGSKT